MLSEKTKRLVTAYDNAVESFFEAWLVVLVAAIVLALPFVKWGVIVGLFYKIFLE